MLLLFAINPPLGLYEVPVGLMFRHDFWIMLLAYCLLPEI
jgi:hypothetical protein